MTTSINDATVNNIASLASHGESRSETHQQEEANVVNPSCSKKANDTISSLSKTGASMVGGRRMLLYSK